jgi:hypothetical protein
MITLTATTHILELTTGSATNIDVAVSYADHTTTGATLGDQQTLITTATTTTILSAPGASTQRQVKYISILNTSASNNAITLKKDISGTEYDLFTVTLGQSERLEYLDGQGFRVYASTGAIKTSQNQGANAISSSISATVLSADVTNNNAVANTIADVTGLSFPVTNGNSYWFRFIIRYTAAATTTGSRWSINGPTTSAMAFKVSTPLISTVNSTDSVSVTNAITYDNPTTANATSPNNTATAGQIVTIEGLLTASADGNVIARFSSEVASSAIIARAGSVVYYQEVA